MRDKAARSGCFGAWLKDHLRLDLDPSELVRLEAAADGEGIDLSAFLVPEGSRRAGSDYAYSLKVRALQRVMQWCFCLDIIITNGVRVQLVGFGAFLCQPLAQDRG